jgi:hypothetical protein
LLPSWLFESPSTNHLQIAGIWPAMFTTQPKKKPAMYSAKHHAMDHCSWLDPQSSGQKGYLSGKDGSFTSYDAETGQVYSEKTIRARVKQRAGWIYDFKAAAIVKRRQPNRDGASSLLDMARAKVGREMRNLTPDHFDAIPWAIGKKVWAEIEDR